MCGVFGKMIIRGHEFDFKKTTYVMGILNVTPDSFSDGGLHNSPDIAVAYALSMIDDGASIIDIGGESTRPGYEKVDIKTELQRTIPVIEELRSISTIPISIDTTKAEVVKAALAAGADIVNTVEGLGIGREMLDAVKAAGAYLVMTYEDSYVNQFGKSLEEMAKKAEAAGIARDKIIVDPGIGFGKTQEENLRILNELPFITQAGYPVLLGASRKSVIGNVLDVPAADRLPGTIVTTTLAALAGVAVVRVHDVAENVRAIKMLQAICASTDSNAEE